MKRVRQQGMLVRLVATDDPANYRGSDTQSALRRGYGTVIQRPVMPTQSTTSLHRCSNGCIAIARKARCC